jgi:hypothetical protein
MGSRTKGDLDEKKNFDALDKRFERTFFDRNGIKFS